MDIGNNNPDLNSDPNQEPKKETNLDSNQEPKTDTNQGSKANQNPGTNQDTKTDSKNKPKQKPKTDLKAESKSKPKEDSKETGELIDLDLNFDKLFEGRSKLHRIGYSYLLAELHKRAGDKTKRTQIIKANPDVVRAACNIIREDLGIKDFDDQVEMAFLLVLYIAR
jgi:hypothetical protein